MEYTTYYLKIWYKTDEFVTYLMRKVLALNIMASGLGLGRKTK